MVTYLVALLCVLGIAVGQLLFKSGAMALTAAGSWYAPRAALALFAAVSLYGITSLAWVWVLQKAELGRVYPLMALAFVLVPVGSYLVFGERFQWQYFLGVALIMLGIVIAVRA